MAGATAVGLPCPLRAADAGQSVSRPSCSALRRRIVLFVALQRCRARAMRCRDRLHTGPSLSCDRTSGRGNGVYALRDAPFVCVVSLQLPL